MSTTYLEYRYSPQSNRDVVELFLRDDPEEDDDDEGEDSRDEDDEEEDDGDSDEGYSE